MNNEANSAVTAFPLAWPVGWVRTPANRRKRAAFSKAARKTSEHAWTNRRGVSVAEASEFLQDELYRLGVRSRFVLSTNLKLRIDGMPYSNLAEPVECGAAVYFKVNGTDQVMACETFDRVADNIMAIAKIIESKRMELRYGVGTVEQSFRGYLALPQETTRPWWVVLEIPQDSTAEEINAAYKRKAMTCHPDRGGTEAQWHELQRAQDVALAAVSP